jgi:hypothetical protein
MALALEKRVVMNEILTSFAILGFPIVLGYLLIITLIGKNHKLPLLATVSLGYGIGTGIITQWCFFLGLVSIELNFININVPLILGSLVLFYINKDSFLKTSFKKISSTKINILSILLQFYISVIFIYIFWRCFNIPITTWDAIATHSFSAKILFYERSLEYINNMPHPEYPLHLPLLEAWFCISFNSWNEQLPKIIFALYSLSLTINIYYFLKSLVKRQWALLGIVLTISSPFLFYHSTIAYRDLTLAYYNISTIILILVWLKQKNQGYLYIAGLMAGFTSFIKIEGAGYLCIHIFLLVLLLLKLQTLDFLEKMKHLLRFVIPSVAICTFFHIYKYINLEKTENLHGNSPNLYNIQIELSLKNFYQLYDVLTYFFINIFFTANWGFLGLLFLISLYQLTFDKISREIQILLIAVFLHCSLYIFIYSFTQHYVWISSHTALSRSLLHFFPLIPILIILLNFSIKKENEIT